MVSMDLHSVSAIHQQHKDSVVRIVLAGGIVELYSGAVPASLVMGRHPGLCLARPEVFKRPRESLVGPNERLLPGQKFYLIPRSTIMKLRRKNPCRLGDGDAKETVVDKVKGGEVDRVSEEFVCSAKDFYVSKEKWSDCFAQRLDTGGAEQQVQKPFAPPIKMLVRSRLGLLGGWKPSLASVEELSP